MVKENHNALFNRADLVESTKDPVCSECDELAIFALRDSKGNEFSLNLSTILECLKFAENQGVLPPINESWWIEIASIAKVPSNQV